jgi:endonuclease/exonuclease/phosphatase family metal-dependent hydrolase
MGTTCVLIMLPVALILTWNVAGRVRESQERQLDALADWAPDVLCLQEVTPTNRVRWEEFLAGRGMHVAVSSFPPSPRGSRRLAVLIASKAALEPLAAPVLPWPERYLAARTVLDGSEVEVHNLHAPLSQKAERVKVRTLEAVFEHLVAAPPGTPRVVAGDFNTPQYESREGEIHTFARTRAGNIRPAYGERHDRAELGLIDGLPRSGWRDAFRTLHGYEARDRSWVPLYRGPGYRLDHIVVSAEVTPRACEYLHAWREQRLSDHSAMWAELDVATG